MEMYAVASTLIKEGIGKMNIMTDIRPIEANSTDEAMGIYMREITVEFKEHNVHVRPVVLLTSSNSETLEKTDNYKYLKEDLALYRSLKETISRCSGLVYSGIRAAMLMIELRIENETGKKPEGI